MLKLLDNEARRDESNSDFNTMSKKRISWMRVSVDDDDDDDNDDDKKNR